MKPKIRRCPDSVVAFYGVLFRAFSTGLIGFHCMAEVTQYSHCSQGDQLKAIASCSFKGKERVEDDLCSPDHGEENHSATGREED